MDIESLSKLKVSNATATVIVLVVAICLPLVDYCFYRPQAFFGQDALIRLIMVSVIGLANYVVNYLALTVCIAYSERKDDNPRKLHNIVVMVMIMTTFSLALIYAIAILIDTFFEFSSHGHRLYFVIMEILNLIVCFSLALYEPKKS